ncbi:hypothetical protein [Blastococcus deserti]|uniref:Uncharacterized protein n=1 Tax=Blastococcus deserti TaxID=2259033 RepID=A0ABW4XDR1_9ACTN
MNGAQQTDGRTDGVVGEELPGCRPDEIRVNVLPGLDGTDERVHRVRHPARCGQDHGVVSQ